MSWIEYHASSEEYASLAEVALRQGDSLRASELYRLAAEQENLALAELGPSKRRTIGITAVSAASLWYKAKEYERAQNVAHQALASNSLPAFAAEQLRSLLQTIWSDEEREKLGLEFTRGEVLVSVSGGEVVTGGAPLDLILRKVDEIGRMFYRVIEMRLGLPLRRRGAPSAEIQEQFRPWLFQAPTGSYQFAVRVEKPRQMSLFPDATPQVEQITETFLDIVRTTVDDPEGELVATVPDRDYRDTFLKLCRNLTPTGKSFERMEIRPTGIDRRPIVLMPAAREAINDALRRTEPRETRKAQAERVQLRGTLRGLHLDEDWLEINVPDDPRTIRVHETGDVIDDVVGPMANHRVVLDAILTSGNRYIYKDIQIDE